jgi:hypothetical protein
MKRKNRYITIPWFAAIKMYFLWAGLLCSVLLNAQPEGNINLTIHLRGVYESKFTLMTFKEESQLMQEILTHEAIRKGESATFSVPAKYLPGEFVIRSNYKEKQTSSPYPSEKQIVISWNDVEIWLHPVYSNNTDSTWFNEDERENTVLQEFMDMNYQKKEVISLLQNFLLYYDDTGSDFYKLGITEYEKRRKEHNSWIALQEKDNNELFVSRMMKLQYITRIAWGVTEDERWQGYIDHYFDFMDFKDSLIIKASDMKSWMDQYVNIYGQEASTTELRDSLFTLAGERAIEKAKTGHPKVYGWMVDYFYRGYESFNIEPGIAMLGQYLDDPNCLTMKKQAIAKRMEGMKNLVPGTIAPDFPFKDVETGVESTLHSYQTDKPYKLVLFWSADCQHCLELTGKLYRWYIKEENEVNMDIFAISLDETDVELKTWDEYKDDYTGWVHILAKGGVNSHEANIYYVLATPVMVLVDAKSNEIVALPMTFEDLLSELE